MEPVRVAVVGAGFMGREHLAAYGRHPLAEVAAVVDVREDLARRAAAGAGAAAFTDTADMLAGADVQAVSICTSDDAHVAPTLACLAAGKHVLLEKPVATTLADADAIVAAAERASGGLLVGQVLRFDPQYALVKARADAGELGEIVAVFSRRLNHVGSQERLRGRVSVLSFLGVHDFDYLLWLLARPAEQVHTVAAAKVHKAAGYDIEDHTFTVIRFAGGAIGCVEAGWALPNTHPRKGDFKLEVIGTAGMAQVDQFSHDLAICAAGGWEVPRIGHGLDPEIAHFLDCARGLAEPLVTGAQAREALRLSLAAQESAATGRPVELAADGGREDK